MGHPALRASIFDASKAHVVGPYTAAPGTGQMTMPWYSDYSHFLFWFFFICSGLISLWLAQAFYLAARGGESKFPVRETRGFSRAQTGDALTAVIPLCWSLSMLAHASTHSSAFDENTSNSALSLTVIAYQWGWNYYLPADTATGPALTLDIPDCQPLRAPLTPTPRALASRSGGAAPALSVPPHLSDALLAPTLGAPLRPGADLYPYWEEHLADLEASTTREAGPWQGSGHEWAGSARRLRTTSGMVLPSDLPLHVICGSKDVVHSWAIPGLGVKVDCVPGFNSHRHILLRWRGVFWGQCMEVCGRYHHWMPILVRVAHPDSFVFWCRTLLHNA